jgi:beta-lactamase superfamily II metal-dependent hydrolase
LSWPGEGPNGETVTGPDLLRRTVLYKVGHHGSHNATLREKGLEMMEAPDLVAMIPVDEDWAHERKPNKWEHPAEKLLARLKEKARGRIIRTDQIPTGDQKPRKPSQASQSEWRAFIKQLDWDRGPNQLWIQYTVPE